MKKKLQAAHIVALLKCCVATMVLVVRVKGMVKAMGKLMMVNLSDDEAEAIEQMGGIYDVVMSEILSHFISTGQKEKYSTTYDKYNAAKTTKVEPIPPTVGAYKAAYVWHSVEHYKRTQWPTLMTRTIEQLKATAKNNHQWVTNIEVIVKVHADECFTKES